MATIKPFRAWRYHDSLANQMAKLICPPFDVLSQNQINKLYQTPYNGIHLSIPEGSNDTFNVKGRLNEWKEKRVIQIDNKPSIYVYYQYYHIASHKKPQCLKGFICNIRATEWEEKIILRHEATIPNSVNDRVDLLKETQMHMSPTHGIYDDASLCLSPYMDKAIESPLYDFTDDLGVRHVMTAIDDKDIVNKFVDTLKGKQVVLADGHHRYESSLIYKRQKQKDNKQHTGNEGYNYHLMFLSNIYHNDIHILPTHRVVKGIADFDEQVFFQKLNLYFNIHKPQSLEELKKGIGKKKNTFGLITESTMYILDLKPECLSIIHWNFPDMIKALDLTILHYFILEKGLGIPGKSQSSSPNIGYEKDISTCISLVNDKKATFAVVTDDISIKEVMKVCKSGYTLPQKSTYFYPKIICGLTFSSIED